MTDSASPSRARHPAVRIAILSLVLGLPACSDLSREAEKTNLKVIALSMMNAENAMRAVPGAIVDADGKPLLSWRVALLPYLDDGGQALFEQFHLDEPWDSDHNKTLIPRMPAVFAAARVPPDRGLTGVVVPAGPGMAFGDPDGTVHIGGEDGPPATAVSLRSITDGLSNTAFMVAIPGLEVPWTQPADHEADPAELFAALKQKGIRTVTVVAADGSVWEISTGAKPEALRAYFSKAGAEVFDYDDLQ